MKVELKMLKSVSKPFVYIVISCCVCLITTIYSYLDLSYTTDRNFYAARNFTMDASGNFYFPATNCLIKFDPAKRSSENWSGCNTNFPLVPRELAASPKGQFYGYYFNHYDLQHPAPFISKFDNTGKVIKLWPLVSSKFSTPFIPDGIAVDDAGMVYVLDTVVKQSRILEYDADGNYIGEWVEPDASFEEKARVFDLTDSAGNTYNVDSNLVEKTDSSGKLLAKWTIKLPIKGYEKEVLNINEVKVDKQGRVYALITDVQGNFTSYLVVYDSNGNALTYYSSIKDPNSVILPGIGLILGGFLFSVLLFITCIMFLEGLYIKKPLTSISAYDYRP